MNPIDDLFREGLGGHAGEVPEDMWTRINAGKVPVTPVGEDIDQLFAGKLSDRAGEVPADMWARIAAVGGTMVPEGADIDQTFADKLKDSTGEIPAGMWQRIWRGVSAPVPTTFAYRRWLIAGLAALLLLGGVAWWQLSDDLTPVNTPAEIGEGVVADAPGHDQVHYSDDLKENLAPGKEAINSAAVAASGAAAGATAGTKAKEVGELTPMASEETPTADRTYPAAIPAMESPTVNTSPLNEDLSDVIVPPNDPTIELKRTDREADVATAIKELSARSLDLLPLADTELDVKRHHRVKPLGNTSFRAAPRHRFQTEFLFGVAYANQQFYVADEANRLLRSAREVSEFPEASYQVTLRTNYRLSDRLQLAGGLTYAEIRNQLEYDQIINGAPTLVKINNSIRLLEAPLLLGYRLPGRRLHVALNAGPVINLSTSARGRFISPDATAPLDLATEGNYRRHIGIGLMTSLSTTYRIGEKDPFLLVVEPFFKTYPGAFTIKDAPLREKYWVAGLQLGIRKEF